MFREKLRFELRVSWKEKRFFSLSKAGDFLCVFRLSVINYLKVSDFDAKLMAQWVQLSINHLHFNLHQCIFRFVASIWTLFFHKICRKTVSSFGNSFGINLSLSKVWALKRPGPKIWMPLLNFTKPKLQVNANTPSLNPRSRSYL